MRLIFPLAITGLMSSQAIAGDLNVSVEIPKLNVAEYHRPYVALWLEKPDQSFAGNLAVWYDIKKNDKGGEKYLKDMRQWWRRAGRDTQLPVDGVSGATRNPGEYQLNFPSAKAPFDHLPAGDYQLVVEAAREDGGREVIKVPFQWPAKAPQNAKAQGQSELGAVSLTVKP